MIKRKALLPFSECTLESLRIGLNSGMLLSAMTKSALVASLESKQMRHKFYLKLAVVILELLSAVKMWGLATLLWTRLFQTHWLCRVSKCHHLFSFARLKLRAVEITRNLSKFCIIWHVKTLHSTLKQTKKLGKCWFPAKVNSTWKF